MSADAGLTILHATTIARRRSGRWRGVLIQGASGVGKSDLALRAMAAGWRLVADDRTVVWLSGGRIFGRAPARLGGLVEARCLGVFAAAAVPVVELSLAAVCVQDRAGLERMPEPAVSTVLGATMPCVRLFACEASALAKLALAFQAVERRFDRAEQERI